MIGARKVLKIKAFWALLVKSEYVLQPARYWQDHDLRKSGDRDKVQ